ncbi:hypothetical protein QL285_047450 [Trifolium repens]|nr:hypothetical protein QL285_047450 [Trifolium repens]
MVMIKIPKIEVFFFLTTPFSTHLFLFVFPPFSSSSPTLPSHRLPSRRLTILVSPDFGLTVTLTIGKQNLSSHTQSQITTYSMLK